MPSDSTQAFTSGSEHDRRVSECIRAYRAEASQPLPEDLDTQDVDLSRFATWNDARVLTRTYSSSEPLVFNGAKRLPADTGSVPVWASQHSAENLSMTIQGNGRFSLALYYDGSSDAVALLNKSPAPISLQPRTGAGSEAPTAVKTIRPNQTELIGKGGWSVRYTPVGGKVAQFLHFHVCERRFRYAVEDPPAGLKKRAFPEEDTPLEADGPAAKRHKPVPQIKFDEFELELALPALPQTGYSRLALPAPSGKLTGQNHAVVPTSPLEMSNNQALFMSRTSSIPGEPSEVVQYILTKDSDIRRKGAAALFRATHSGHTDKGLVVVKILRHLPKNQAAYAGTVVSRSNLWLKEYEHHRRMNHPRIARLLAADARLCAFYIENIEARDLSCQVTLSSTFSGTAVDAARILYDVAGAVKYMHSVGMIHLDIKPGNILYSPLRGAVLIDLGLAATSHQQGPDGRRLYEPSFAGTPWYVPPELLDGERGEPSDIYALGITMLYLLHRIQLPEYVRDVPGLRRDGFRIAKIGLEAAQDPSHKTERAAAEGWNRYVKRIATDSADYAARDKNLPGWQADLLTLVAKEMLDFDPRRRISATQLVQEASRIRGLATNVQS